MHDRLAWDKRDWMWLVARSGSQAVPRKGRHERRREGLAPSANGGSLQPLRSTRFRRPMRAERVHGRSCMGPPRASAETVARPRQLIQRFLFAARWRDSFHPPTASPPQAHRAGGRRAKRRSRATRRSLSALFLSAWSRLESRGEFPLPPPHSLTSPGGHP